MINRLFSMFDPGIRVGSSSWLVVGGVLIVLPLIYWIRGRRSFTLVALIERVKTEVDSTIKKAPKGTYQTVGAIFIALALLNSLALAPFVFSSTSHLLITAPLGYTIWLRTILFSWVKSIKDFLSHLVPSGTPPVLIRFIVLVELLRSLIRPLALTFRLTANIMAGHLLMSLIGTALVPSTPILLVLGSIGQILLVTIELGVSFIQAYVFSVLVLLYISEREK